MDERIFVWARRRPQGIQRRIAKGVDEETSGNPPPKTVVSSILFTLPVVRNDFTGYCKREEKKDCSLYEEIFIIGLYEQKIILTITIMDYTTKIAHAKTVDDLLSHMPIVKFLASLSVTGVDPALPRNTSGFILR